MIRAWFSNRYEPLADRLVDALGGARASVFEAEQVIVPSAALQRDIALRMAARHGVCAQVRFDFLAQWLWRQIGRAVPQVGAQTPFAPAALAWRIDRLLADPALSAGHPRLSGYLGGADAVMRFGFAGRLAGLYDQLITYRSDWLAAWAEGRSALPAGAAVTPVWCADEAWQAALWRRLLAELGIGGSHPARHYLDALAADAGSLAPAGPVHLFGLPAIPPLYLQVLRGLGRHADLRLYLLNPCREYWFDLVAPKRLHHLAARGLAEHLEVGNPLLGGWAGQTQAQIDLLLEGDGVDDDADFVEAPGGHLLARLQNAVLDGAALAPRSIPLAAEDRSLELHVCHSLTRELEVLQDRLLGLFAQGSDLPGGALQPQDVLVVTPDLEAAAPLIDAVFGTAPPERHIPFAVTGRPRRTVNRCARALRDLLALLAGDGAASAVFDLLQQPAVARRAGLDAAALEQVHGWMAEAGIRRGLAEAPPAGEAGRGADADEDIGTGAGAGVVASAGGRADSGAGTGPGADARAGAHAGADAGAGAGASSAPRHGLAAGLQRLFLARALPGAVDQPFEGELPAGQVEGSEALRLGALWRHAQRLQHWQQAHARAHPPAGWLALLLSTLDELLAVDPDDRDEQDELRELQATLRGLTEQMTAGGVTGPVEPAVLRAALEAVLDEPARGGVPTGRVSFAAMSSLRGLPFRVIAAIGLDDGAFPSTSRALEFDLMATQPRRGDRQRRHEERNAFLDLLLSARELLHLSHTGRSLRDNAPLPPSVLVDELLDLLRPAVDAGPDDASARARLVVEHPLQAFSPRAFSLVGDPRLRSHHREYAQALQASRALPVPRPRPPGARTAAGHGMRNDASHPTGHAAEGGRYGGKDSDSDAADARAELADLPDADDLQPPEPSLAFFDAPLPGPDAPWRTLDIDTLVRFFEQPCRHLLEQRLGLSLPRAEEALEDDEPFEAGWQGRDELVRHVLPAALAGAPAERLQALAAAGVCQPTGSIGAAWRDQELHGLTRHAAALREALAPPVLDRPVQADWRFDLDGDTWQLGAAFGTLRATGLVQHRYANARVREHLRAWLWHLALCAAAPPGVARRTRFIARDMVLEFSPCDDPLDQLACLLRLVREGLRLPLHFYPRSAWAYAEKGSLAAARASWFVTRQYPHGEAGDPAHRLALRGLADPLDEAFVRCADAVLGPLRAHLRQQPLGAGDGAGA